MANKVFQKILKKDIKSLIDESKSINSINHQGLKGSIREYNIGKVIEKYLPQDFAVGCGQIHDCEGTQSNETDLLIFNKHILPPIMFGEATGFYPLESCFYSIEAKTTSTSKEIKSTISKFNSLKKLNSLNKQHHPIRVYISLASDLKKMDELKRYKKYDKNFYNSPAIQVISVIGQGYWFHKTKKMKNGTIYGYWSFCEPDGNFELGCLIGGIINTLNGVKNNPLFGYYLLPNKDFKIVDQKKIN